MKPVRHQNILSKNRCLRSAMVLLPLLILGIQALRAQPELQLLELDTSRKNNLNAEVISGGWQLNTTGKSPWIFTKPLTRAVASNAAILSFEYFSPKGLDMFRVFFGPEINAKHAKIVRDVGVAEGWITYSVDVSKEKKAWGKAGDYLRLDLGSLPGIQIQIKNLLLRPMTVREKELALVRTEKLQKEAAMEARLKNYLTQSYRGNITGVTVAKNSIVINGFTGKASNVYLVEITPYQDVTEKTDFDDPVKLKKERFSLKLNRFVQKEGFLYDRLLSKWALVTKGNNGYSLISHAHYPDSIIAEHNLQNELPKGRKGLGGFSTGRGHASDLDDLNITSATVNIWFARFMFTTPGAGRIQHNYNGRSYYFGAKQVANFDSTFLATSRKGIVTAAILLVDKAEKCADPEIGRLLQHPDMDPAGIYSMPNMTTPASVDCYAAALDFLASRYSRPDKKYGRLNHWIMHNEVDAGWEWTNMGEKTASVFMDAYIKSMRLCYAIARKYNPHSEVFISLTHYWAWTSHPRFYPSKKLMEILLQYSKAEGDFQWAMAHHPYPQSLFEPKTWLDKQVDYTFNSPLITFKNLEVLNAWIKSPEALYKGKTKRTLWLSENGTNSKTYSDLDLAEQAAGFAYTWKKMKVLDGIDAFQWHNWIDNRKEGGLRIGLRRFPDDEKDPGGVKPVWYVFKAADERNEDEVFDLYKKIIGIQSWDEVVYKGTIK